MLTIIRAGIDDSELAIPCVPLRHSAAGGPSGIPAFPASRPVPSLPWLGDWHPGNKFSAINHQSAPTLGKGARDPLFKHQPPHQVTKGGPGPASPLGPIPENAGCAARGGVRGGFPGEGEFGQPWGQAGWECGSAGRPLRNGRAEKCKCVGVLICWEGKSRRLREL